MANNQETLIYIEQENKTEAEFMSRSFIDKEIKNRAYINTIGAELVKKYLTTEGIDCSEVFSIHSISKILEKYDIADIILPNIHIDTRVIFDENQIFIPKSHFELNIEPDIYIILKLDKSFGHVELLGYIKASQINKENQNEQYYFVEKSDLESTQTLTSYIKNFVGNTNQDISEDELLKGRELSISLADHDITPFEEHELLELLLVSQALRESVLEFDNFETLSYSATPTLSETTTEDIVPNSTTLTLADMSMNEELAIEETFPEISENIEDSFETEVESDTEVDTIETEQSNDETTIEQEQIETIEDDKFNDIENISIDEQYTPELPEELSVDAILDNTIASIDNINNEVTDDINIDLDEAASATAEALANAVAEAENTPETSSTISDEAIKLASVSGEIVNDTVQILEDEQQKNLDKIDYEKTDIHAEIGETPEYILAEAENLHSAKQDANLEAEESGLFETPTDITDLNTVEAYEEKEFIQESVDFGAIENVDKEILELNATNSLDMESLTDLNIDTEIEELPEIDTMNTEEIVDVANFESNITLDESISDLPQEEMLDIDINMQEPALPEENLTNTVNQENILPFDENSLDFSSCLKPSTRRKEEQTSFYSDDKPTIDEETKKALFANNIVSDSNDNNDEEIDFGETIVIEDDEEPFNIEVENEIIETVDNISELDNELELENEEVTTEDLFGDESSEILEDYSELDDELKIENEEVTADVLFGDESSEILEDYSELDNELKIEDEESSTEEELTLDDLDMLSENTNEEENVNDITQSPEDFFKDYEEPKTEVLDDEEFLSSAEGFESKMFNFEEETEEQPQEEEDTISAEEWMANTDYENLEEVDFQTAPIPQELENDEVLKTQTTAAMENSRIISDKTFQAGEIPIDINNADIQQYSGHESLENIYDPNANFAGESLIQNPGRLSTNQNRSSSAGIIGVIGTLIVLAIVGGIGFGVAKLFKTPTEEAPQPITDEPIPTSLDNGVTETNTLNIDPNNVVNMDTNTATKPVTAQPVKKVVQSQTPATVNTNTTQKKGKATSFIGIKKLTWEVPDYISYNQQFKQYFQSVGKSLKLTLTSDLLLATDYLYSDNMRIGITFAKDGTFQNSQIIVSSGSNQIDKIVLQTVNQTLKALKAPNSVGNDENTTAVLKIYF